MKKVAINEDVCIGCGLCRVYCLTAHSVSGDIIKAWKQEMPRALPRIKVEKRGDISFSMQCRHCDEPLCVYSCLSGALRKDSMSGVVTLDSSKCTGCWTCVLTCPHNAITRDTGRKIATKCDLCAGLAIPACVSNCPNGALYLTDIAN